MKMMVAEVIISMKPSVIETTSPKASPDILKYWIAITDKIELGMLPIARLRTILQSMFLNLWCDHKPPDFVIAA